MPVELPNTIFYHVPKTGGTAITYSLIKAGGQKTQPDNTHPLNLAAEHTSPLRYDNPHGKKTFAVFRDPAEWYKSIWAYRTASRWSKPHNSPLDKLNDEDFNVFVKRVLSEFPKGFLSEMYREFEDVDYKFATEKSFTHIDKFIWDMEGKHIRIGNTNASPSYLKSKASYRIGVKQMVYRVEKYAYDLWKKVYEHDFWKGPYGMS